MNKYLRVVPLVILFCFAMACQDKAAMAELERFRAQARIEEQNKELVKRGFEALNKGDFDTIKEMTAPEYVRYIPSNNMDIRSPEGRVAFARALQIGFPDVHFSIEEIYADGDRVIYRFLQRGTHLGDWKGIPATGHRIERSGIGIWRIENGKVVEVREEPDRLGLYQQLGMELKPIEAKK